MQAACCAANPAPHIPFWRWLAAERRALRRVAAIILRAGLGSWEANPCNRGANTPKRLQRKKRLSRVVWGASRWEHRFTARHDADRQVFH